MKQMLDPEIKKMVLGAPCCIAKQTCIVIHDVLSNQLPSTMHDSIVIEQSKGYFLHCSQAAYMQARQAHPRLPIYGFWQVLLASGLIKAEVSLLVVPLAQGHGKFLYRQGSLCLSGETQNDKPILPPALSDSKTSVKQTLHLSPDTLGLPSVPILSFAERKQRQQKDRRWRYIHLSLLGACVMAGGLSLHAHLYQQRQDQNVLYGALQNEVRSLQQEQTLLATRAQSVWSWQWPALDMLYALIRLDQNIHVWGMDFKQTIFEARLNSAIDLPPSLLQDLDSVDYKQDGTKLVRWQVQA